MSLGPTPTTGNDISLTDEATYGHALSDNWRIGISFELPWQSSHLIKELDK